MATSSVRKTALGIINEVERRLGVRDSETLTDRRLTETLLDLLNDVIEEVSDFGDWQEMYREVDVTGVASSRSYEIAVSSQVKNIYEIHWGIDVAPLEVREIQTMRRLRRTGSLGTPRQFAIVGVSGVNPLIEVFPAPSAVVASSGRAFNVAYYKKPSLLTTADSSTTPAFSSRVLVQGLYAKALLEENGGVQTPQYQTAYAEYLRMRKETLNRLTADTGTDIYFVPTGKYGSRSR